MKFPNVSPYTWSEKALYLLACVEKSLSSAWMIANEMLTWGYENLLVQQEIFHDVCVHGVEFGLDIVVAQFLLFQDGAHLLHFEDAPFPTLCLPGSVGGGRGLRSQAPLPFLAGNLALDFLFVAGPTFTAVGLSTGFLRLCGFRTIGELLLDGHAV
jgi:hypothetical protein